MLPHELLHRTPDGHRRGLELAVRAELRGRAATIAIATITLGTDGDPDFWTPEELRERAIYINKMASKLDRHGEGLGALMIRWVQDRAARLGLDTVRWDAWRTNPELQDYYRSIGARHVRTVDVADRWSGALFEVPAEVDNALPEHLATAA